MAICGVYILYVWGSGSIWLCAIHILAVRMWQWNFNFAIYLVFQIMCLIMCLGLY